MIRKLLRRVRQRWHLLIPITLLAIVLSRHTAVVLHAADGDLDPTFGDAGKVTIGFIYHDPDGGDFSTSDAAQAVAIQPNGKIVTVGRSSLSYVIALSLARTNPDGSPDRTFGDGGRVVDDFGQGGGSIHSATAVMIQPDGKILIGGNASSFGQSPNNFLLVRYNSDGTLDSSFGDGGRVLTDFGFDLEDPFHRIDASVSSLALQSDGKIVAAGSRSDVTSDFALARYNPDGSLDSTFGTDGRAGRVVTKIGTSGSWIEHVAVQEDGRIVAAGLWANDFVLARYNTDGSLDATFSDDGIVATDFGGEEVARAVVIQADGTIVVAGETITPVSGTDFALARYNADGTLDATFGAGGLVTTDFGGADDDARDVALQADGKIVAAGTSFLAGGGTGSDIAVARYETDGTLDPTFGIGGLVTTDITGPGDEGNAVAIQANGKIVVAGTANAGEPSDGDFVIVRYEGTRPAPGRAEPRAWR